MTAQRIVPQAVVVAGSPDMLDVVASELAPRLGPGMATADTLAEALDFGGPVIVICSPSLDVLAYFIARRMGAEAAGREWNRWALDVLDARRQNRRRLILVAADALTESAPRIAKQFDLPPHAELSDLTPPSAPATARMAAASLLLAAPDLALTAAELAVETMGAGPGNPIAAQIDAAIADHAADQERLAALEETLVGLKAEFAEQARSIHALLRQEVGLADDAEATMADLRQTVTDAATEAQGIQRKQKEIIMLQASEIERHARRQVELELRHTARVKELEHARNALQRHHDATLHKEIAERERLQSQQASQSAEISQLRAELEQATKAVEPLDARITELESELARVYASRSWRVTGPLRAIRHNVAR